MGALQKARMRHQKLLFVCVFSCLLLGFTSASLANPHATHSNTHKQRVAKRIEQLKSLILEHTERPAEEKLTAVNTFFNEVRWVSDLSQWGQPDYWQTPRETLTIFKGDCEDVAIAKYAALRKMGIPDEKLAIVYTMKKGQPHMVLAYYESAGDDPVVLDSFDNPASATASRRKDLRPVYGFNSTRLWLTDRHMRKLGSDQPLPASHRISQR